MAKPLATISTWLFLCLLLVSCAPPASVPAESKATATSAAAPAVNWEALAQQLVTQNASVKENDIVLIVGGVQDGELLEDIAVHVRKAGAFPLVRITSDRMTKRMATEVPEQFDSQVLQQDMKLAGLVNVRISIDSGLAENPLGDVDPKRREALDKATAAVDDEFMKRNVRQVILGNNLYPADWRAKRYGVSQQEMTKLFWDGVNMDYAVVPATGAAVKKALATAKELHITNPNGTDLKVNIQGKPIGVSDGVISLEDAKAGGSNATIWLPAGEVYLVPVSGTAEGKVVQTRGTYQESGKEIEDLTLTFAKGTVVSITGTGPGFGDFKARYDVAGSGKDALAYIDFGINPRVKMPEATKYGNWVPAGSITVGIGGNTWAGGDNDTGFAQALFLPGSTVLVDGRPIVEKGVLKP